MVIPKKYLLFVSSSVGLCSAGAYFLWPTHRPDQTESEKLGIPPSEDVSTDEFIAGDAEENVLSEAAEEPQSQDGSVGDDTTPAAPISQRF